MKAGEVDKRAPAATPAGRFGGLTVARRATIMGASIEGRNQVERLRAGDEDKASQQQSPPSASLWLPGAHEDALGPQDTEPSASEGLQAPGAQPTGLVPPLARTAVAVAWLVATAVAFSGSVIAGEAVYPRPKPQVCGKGWLELRGGLPVVHLAGGPAERGSQHGRLLRPQVGALIERYLGAFTAEPTYRTGALALALGLAPFVPREYALELKALAEASGLEFRDALLGNAFPDISRAVCCSIVAATGRATRDGRLLLARNLDFPTLGLLEKASVVFVYHHRAQGRHSFVAVGWPGMIGALSGMNDARLCLATAMVFEVHGMQPGMPYTMMYRQILEGCKTPAEAVALIRRTRRTTANNLVLAAPGHVPIVVEFTPAKVAVRQAEDDLLLVTNHFRSPEMTDRPEPCDDRYDKLTQLTARHRGRLDHQSLKRILHAVNQGELTCQAMVFEPAGMRLEVATGRTPATEAQYVVLDCRELLGAEGPR